MKKYTNIVFDMGNVLLDYSPHLIVSKFTDDIQLVQLLVNEIFYKQEWLDLDQGIIKEDEAIGSISKRIDSKYLDLVKQIFNKWHLYLTEREEMIDLLKMLKSKGYKLYLFSNASLRFYQYVNSFKCLDYFDLKVISADLKVSKPNLDFYRQASSLCQIDLKESFFIDDSAVNILESNTLNMDGYIYNGTFRLLIEYLRKVNIID
ncbi:MAG TPA: HAD-IA family hydrolase [Erysipelotrichaceae bacterium]|nr:HAD-IA family hydrolase [Erysipelotrichaceae bacterium]